MRTLTSSGSPFEKSIGFSRAVRVGNIVEVAGTAPIAENGEVFATGDVYRQTQRCLAIIAQALRDAGSDVRHVVRMRIMLRDMTHWRDAARAHGEVFADIRPACTFVEVSGFIDPDWLVEIEATAIVG